MEVRDAIKQFKEWENSGWSKSETPYAMDHSKYLYKALKSAEQYMTEKGVSHEYPVMINARKALAEYERRNQSC